MPENSDGTLSKTLTYYASFIALGLTSASLGPTLLGLAQQTGSRISQISVLFTARALGYMLGSFLGGRMFDRYPGHRTMAAALIVIALLLASIPAVPLLALLAWMLLAIGAMEGAIDVGGNSLLIWTHGDRVAPYMNGLHLFYAVGAFLSPVFIARAVAITGSYRWGYWVLSLLLLPIGIRFLPLAEPKSGLKRADPSDSPPSLVLLALITLFFLLMSGSEQSFGGWIFTYSVKTRLADATTGAYVNAAFWGAFMISRAASIPLGAWFRPKSILFADLILSLVGLSVLLVFHASHVALWAGAVLFGLGIASGFPTMMTFVGRRMAMTGAATGWFLVGASGGTMILPWLIGQGIESVGPRIVPLVIAGALALALGILSFLIEGLD